MATATPESHALEGFIRRLQIHSPLDPADVQAIRQLDVDLRRRPPHTQLVREGDHTSHCSILVQGFAYRFRVTDAGSRQILGLYVPGDPLDLDHLYLPVADDTLQAVRECVLACIRHKTLRELMAERQAVAAAITRVMLVASSIFREWTLNVGRRDARARIAHLLCELCVRLEAQNFDFANTPLPLSQEQIADATGLTAIHVNRTLKSLSAEKLIQRKGASVMLRHPASLQHVAGFDARYLHRELSQGAF